MKLTKYDKIESTGNTTLIGGSTTINENNQGGGGTRGDSGGRTIWGQYDEGDNDIDGSATIHGDVHIKSITPKTYDPDDEGDDGETIEEEEGGGSLDVELDVTVGRHLFVNYPSHPEHPEANKVCIGEVLGGIEKNLSDEVTRAKNAEKANSDAIAAEETRAKAAEKVNADAIAAETSRAEAAETANADNIATNADEIDKLKNRTTANENAIANYLPIGSIIMFNGQASQIPDGWAICNGENGTPNLVDKFIKASNTAGQTGGSNSVTLSKSNLPKLELHVDSAKVNANKDWDVRLSKYVPTLDSVGEYVFDEGGSTHYCLYTGKHEGDKGLLGITYPSIFSDIESYMYIGDKDATQTAVSTEPEYYSLIFIMKIA